MDNPVQGKSHSSGHESHVVHLCHKCGWPFPNPHPSAKHRRAHKKICGTIEGYKLVDSGDITHTTASDDEPLSEEGRKTPIAQVPKVMESSLGRQDSLDNVSKADKNAEKDQTATISVKDCEDTDILQPPQNSADRSQKENPVPKSMPMLLMGTPAHQDLGLSYRKDSESRNGSASDVFPIKTEALVNVSEDSRKVSAGDKVAECSVRQENTTNKNEGKLNKNLLGGLILPSEHAGEISETVSMSEKGLNITLDMVLTDNTVQLKEEFSDRLASKISTSENGEQETDGEGNPGINLERNLLDVVASNNKHPSVPSEKTEDITSESGLADKIVELEENSNKFTRNMVIDDLSPKAESAKNMDASTDIFQIHTDAVQGTDTATSVNSNEVYDKMEKENESVYVLSVPDDIPVADNAVIKLEGFKDHKRVKLPQLEAFASEEIIIDKEDGVSDHVSQEKSDTFQSNQLDEDIKVGSSYMHAAEDSYRLGGNNESMVKEVVIEGEADVLQINKGSPVNADTTEDEKVCPLKEQQPIEAMVKEVVVEGEADVLQINKGSDALGSPVNADTTENEKVCPLKEQQPVYVSDDLQPIGFSGSMINLLPAVNPMTAHAVAHADIEARGLDNEVGGDDMGFPERSRTGAIDIAGVDNTRRIDDENYVKNAVASCESTNNSSLSQINPAFNLHEVDNSDDIATRKTEKYDINVVESGDGLEEACASMNTNSIFESISTHHQPPVVLEEVNNDYVRTLPETEGPQLNTVPNSQDDIKESEKKGDNNVQGESAGEDLMASALGNTGGNEFERTSVDQLKKELMHSPSYAEPTSQNSGAVDDSHTRESRMGASGISTIILQGQADNGFVKPQLDTTVVDVSIESSSQTDSLEGHWRSVSVLSTQSSNPAMVDTETLPSTGSHEVSEAEKANIKNSKVASEEQHFDKSGEFEPPSFLTLVEPGGRDEKAAASEIQKVQNAQDPIATPLQAGWFPSLTHVAYESPGRKKNEEIIAKLTNRNGKQHTLKNLLGEANSETKQMSPNSKENPAVVIPRKEKVAKDNGALVTKVSSIVGPDTPVSEPTNTEAGKEWNSPARYPADIKRQKRKVKGRPLWVQFVCCLSVN
ncbi:uncharacterized protein LOC111287279 isoform X2 [Durio zibethinus]|uniref:Uncharacterized protein LOC111287279 isoform X1 n=1 Tax=Durio zibethinus TaxID=66656 RepID=A0A6P5XZ65_DURZI|nr:uncharacterized protein LOC111287279 isoform X1 [Durio zibethinus]XP_022733429.1 uncharacterized protein LOC111287279 isoform X2 [Durio zibethinus]